MFEYVEEWIKEFIRQIVDGQVDERNFWTWENLTPQEQGWAFYYLVGAFADAIGVEQTKEEPEGSS